MFNLKYSKVDVLVKSKKPHYFLGSTIRGALGHSLKKVVCINPSKECKNCFAISNCLYYDFYEQLNQYHKYRLDFDIDDELFRFGIYLFDKDAQKLPYIISALYKLFKEIGIGFERKTYDDFYFFINDKEIYSNNNFQIPANYENSFLVDIYCPDVYIKLLTPLRMKQDNKYLRIEDLKIENILYSIFQRYLELSNKEREKFPFEVKYEDFQKKLYFKKLTRFSNRQQTKMSMDGIMGDILIKGLDMQSYQLLKLGEIIGVGKQTVMGLGNIKIEEIK